MILKKIGEEYKLYSHDSCIATTQESPHKRLSKQNCDSLFGVVDVEKLAKEEAIKISESEIEVRIAMRCSLPNGCTEPEVECTCEPTYNLDENGCLTLWVLNT